MSVPAMSPAPILAGAQDVSEASDAEVAASQSWGNMPAGKLALVLLQSVGVCCVSARWGAWRGLSGPTLPRDHPNGSIYLRTKLGSASRN
jgi:hypothetical protein